MRYAEVFLALIVMFAAVAPVAAQLTGEGIEDSLSPLVSLIDGVMRISWTITRLMIGMDEASMAFFAYELGFRGDEVYVDDYFTTGDDRDCGVGSLRIDLEHNWFNASCKEDALDKEESWTQGVLLGKMTEVGDIDEDGTANTTVDVFYYISEIKQKTIAVASGAKGQIMLFAILIPLGILWFLLVDFFTSTGMLRTVTSQVVSLGIALIAARSGVYIGLLSMISNIFGSNGFFMSMLSIYLLLAVLFWFYGGIRRSKKIAESEDVVAKAVVDGYASDLRKGLVARQAAKEIAKEKP